jgi:hypothetical protein
MEKFGSFKTCGKDISRLLGNEAEPGANLQSVQGGGLNSRLKDSPVEDTGAIQPVGKLLQKVTKGTKGKAVA